MTGPPTLEALQAVFLELSRSYSGCQHGPFHPAALRRLPDPCKCPWCGVMVANPLSEEARDARG